MWLRRGRGTGARYAWMVRRAVMAWSSWWSSGS